MKNTKILMFFFLVYVLSSCISYEKYPIEIFQPSEFTLPANIKNITIVSRNLKYNNDTLQNYYLDDFRLKKDKKHINTDSIAISACTDSLKMRLNSSGKFNKVQIYPIHSISASKVNNVRPAPAEWYENICRETSSDGLILLDMFSCFYRQYSNPTPSAWVITSNIWSIYDYSQKKIVDRFSQVDTLYWDGENNKSLNKRMIPAKKTAIKLAAGVIGTNYSKHLLPGWNVVYREIMTRNHPEMKSAALNAKNNNWEDAETIWQNYTESTCRRNRTISLFNLALASEMKGKLDEALEYTANAAKASSCIFLSSENESVRKYAIVLNRRQNELLKFQAQDEK